MEKKGREKLRKEENRSCRRGYERMRGVGKQKLKARHKCKGRGKKCKRRMVIIEGGIRR